MIALLLTDRCTQCQQCVQVCPRNVFDAVPDAPPRISRVSDCQTCYQCELYCQADALYVEPDTDRAVAVDEAQVRAQGLLGVFRRHSGWHEHEGQYPNEHWRMEDVFARGRALSEQRVPTK